MYLVFLVHHLGEAYRGRGPGGREYPPHPVRLGGSLINAWARGGKRPDERRALEWLEGLPPPLVLYPPVSPGGWVSWVAYVPPHDRPEPPGFRGKQPLEHHLLPLPGRLLLYAFPLGDVGEAQAHLPALRALVGRVVYLGTSRNLVAVEVSLCQDPRAAYQEASPLAPRVLSPTEGALGGPLVPLRVVFPGFLRQAEANFQAGLRNLPGRWVGYSPEGGEGSQEASPWGAWRVRALDPPLPLEWAPLLTHAARRALLSLLPPGAPPLLTGHGPSGGPLPAPHLALIPLPNVAHPWADGRVLGLAFLLPQGADPLAEDLLLKALQGLREVHLPGGHSCRLLPPDGRWTLREERWRRPARHYASVLPLVFDRHPKRGDPSPALAFSARAAGLPEPSEAWASPYSPLQGVPPSRHFRLPQGVEGYVAHAVVLFPKPVEGPVLLGRGRYLGLGLMAPMEVEEH